MPALTTDLECGDEFNHDVRLPLPGGAGADSDVDVHRATVSKTAGHWFANTG